MAKTQVLNLKGEKVKDLTLKDAVWNIEVSLLCMMQLFLLKLH